MRTIPDHPEIAHALRTGYPRPHRFVLCADCGQEYSGDHRIYISDGDTVCGDCLKDRLMESYDIDDLADAFDVQKTTAQDYMEELEDRIHDDKG